MTFDELDKLQGLVNDLCLTHAGWRTEDEHADYLAAFNRIAAHGNAIKQQREIERLKQRIQELEGKE